MTKIDPQKMETSFQSKKCKLLNQENLIIRALPVGSYTNTTCGEPHGLAIIKISSKMEPDSGSSERVLRITSS